MISKQELLKKQKDLTIPLSTVEKDYILGLILSSFLGTQLLKSSGFLRVELALKKSIYQNIASAKIYDKKARDHRSCCY